MSIEIVAELAMYHDGDTYKAFQLVREAREAGADAVKFQVWKNEAFMARDYDQYELFAGKELDAKQWADVFAFADDMGISWFATPLDLPSLELLEEQSCPRYKVASSDITFKPLLRELGKLGKPLVISTGGAKISEILRALELITGSPDKMLVHCVMNYPCADEHANVSRLKKMAYFFGRVHYRYGISDHTADGFASCLAVPHDIAYAEKHMAFKPMLDGAVGTFGFTEYVSRIRRAELMMGDGKIEPSENELEHLSLGRRDPTTWRREKVHV